MTSLQTPADATELDVGVEVGDIDAADDDPHASKISPDDPRLNVQRPHSRVLRLKPLLAVGTLLVGVTAFAVMTSLRHTKKAATVVPEPPKVPARDSAIPPFLADIPEGPIPPPPVPAPAIAEPPPPRFAPAAPPSLPPRPDPALERLAQLDEQARSSDLFFASSSNGARGRAAPTLPPPALPAPDMPAAMGAGMSLPGGPAQSAGDDPNLQGRKNAFLEEPREHPDYLKTTLQPPLSPYEVKAATIIPATLLTGINSDLPGPIIAQVRESVYDTVTGEHLLIPQGARLLASYDSMVAWGQERVLLCWHRLLLPNGSSINLECMPAADLQGQAGLTDEVDNHWGRLFAAVGLSTVFALGTQALAGDTSGYQPTLAQTAARSAAGQINAAGQAVVQRQINIQPTITVRPGFGVNVIVTKDMVLQPYLD